MAQVATELLFTLLADQPVVAPVAFSDEDGMGDDDAVVPGADDDDADVEAVPAEDDDAEPAVPGEDETDA